MDRSWFRPGFRCVLAAVAITLFVLVLVLGGLPTPAAGLDAPPGSWTLPVAGAVTRDFEQPASRYGAGHRGVDFAAPAGTPVRAAGDGVVSFAGRVAGELHVVVAHAGDLRTSYSFLATATARRGDAVRRGDVVGTAGGPAGEHPPGLHLGLRTGDEYVDPMLLFRLTDLSEVVHLAPVTRARPPASGSWAAEALGVARGLEPADLRPADLDLAGSAATDPGPGVLGTIGGWFRRAVRAGSDYGRSLPGAADAATAIERLGALARTRLDCTASPADTESPAETGSFGSGHLLMAVAGINSSTDHETGATFGLPPDALGYEAGEVHWYSYASGGGAYRPADTHGRIHDAALRLGEQLRALHTREPGREIDLVAHSQGGVVVDEFLQHVYDAADPRFPPIGTVVTLSSPHQGAPLASAGHDLAATDAGNGALDAAGGLGLPAGAPALADLREGSRTIRGLWRTRLPDQVDFTTIGAVDDVVVPASQTDVPGATQVLVDPAGPLDHSTVTHDDDALAAVRLALEGRPPPCPGVSLALRGAIEPLVITRLEHAAGAAGRAVGRAVDAAAGILP